MKLLARSVFFASYFLSLVSCCFSDVTVARIEVLGYGIYSIPAKRSVDAGDAPSGRRWLALPEIIKDGEDVIPAQLGIHFGFHYLVNGKPNGTPIQLRTVVVFPSPGLTNESGETFLKSEYVETRTIGQKYFVGYGFDRTSEILPGKWTIQLWHNDELLIEKHFTVKEDGGVKPKGAEGQKTEASGDVPRNN